MASSISAGTTSATALVHTADTSGALQLATNNGTVAVTIDTSQNVGVGTASPTYKLDVLGSTARIYNDSATLLLQRPSNSRSGQVLINNANGGIKYYAGANGSGENGVVAHEFVSDAPSTGTVLARINSYGIGLGANTPSSGTGITFPATQSASSNANTLDDYEEGTWTPADGSGAGLSITVTDASYVKIGRLVFINAYFTYPVTANTTSAQLSGLPFTSQSGNNYSFIMGRTQTNLGNMVAWQVNNGNTTLAANLGWNSTTSPTNANLSNSYFLISGCYQSA